MTVSQEELPRGSFAGYRTAARQGQEREEDRHKPGGENRLSLRQGLTQQARRRQEPTFGSSNSNMAGDPPGLAQNSDQSEM
eukprot:2588852-Rhodomonas_salina.1